MSKQFSLSCLSFPKQIFGLFRSIMRNFVVSGIMPRNLEFGVSKIVSIVSVTKTSFCLILSLVCLCFVLDLFL